MRQRNRTGGQYGHDRDGYDELDERESARLAGDAGQGVNGRRAVMRALASLRVSRCGVHHGVTVTTKGAGGIICPASGGAPGAGIICPMEICVAPDCPSSARKRIVVDPATVS